MDYEILRNMESFTQEMFNRIIDFQEKQHPAWDESLSFDERIAKLPLHYLIFSNADRDPNTFGPTVAHYYPLRKEMYSIARYADTAGEKSVIIDAHARNGFIGSLIARETQGTVIGLRDPNEKTNQIQNFYDAERYEIQENTLATYDGPADVIVSSWMPSEVDITDDVIRLNPQIVVYVFTDHVDEENQVRQTGCEGAFGEKLPDAYQLIDEWQVLRPKDLFHEIWPDLTGNIEEVRTVRVYARNGAQNQTLVDINPHYDWEDELLMAETAYTAKQEMMSRGFPPPNM